jgi:predicted phage terminase large subunit-like protein
MIKEEWFNRYDRPPEKFDRIIQSWDTASVASELNSFSVCITFGKKGKQLYILNVFRKRLNYPELKRAVRDQARFHGAAVVLIEHRASGMPLFQELAAEGLRGVTKYEPAGDKVMRLHAQADLIEAGAVHLPQQAPWLADFLHEIVTFPRGAFADQVDALSQALDWAHGRTDCSGWVEHYRREAARARGVPLEPLKFVRMRAPPSRPGGYYMSGTNGRAGRYTPDPDGLIEDVHPEDIERLRRQGCVIVAEAPNEPSA